MIEFANPALLWGALAAAIPLIIHLFNRKRAKPHPFAAIDFVLRSRRRTARRLRLKRLLLFVVRTLLLVAIPVALARPQPKRTEEARAPQGPAATALVVDSSLSMSYQRGSRTLLERAKKMAREAVGNLATEDPLTLVTCEPDAPAPASPGFERGRVLEALDAIPQTWSPQEVTRCLSRAAIALAESPIPGKRILLATDLTAAGFRLDVPAPTVQTPAGEVKPEVVLLDAAEGAELPNAAIVDLRVEPAPSVGARAYQFTATVANHGKAPLKDLPVRLKVGKDVVAKGFVEVPAHGTAVKSLGWRFPAGGSYQGEVQIEPDALTADDVRFFTLKVPKDIRALVVNGSPHAVRFMDEAFFVDAALTAPGSPVHPTLRDSESLAAEKLADYDVVMLLNVRALPPDKARELEAFVRNGGGLFVSMGDQVDPDAYNETLAGLLPRRLHLVKTAAEPREEGSEQKAAKLAQVAFEHPALSIFSGEAREGMLSARTYRYMLLSPGETKDMTVLATYDDGAPALLEARRGRGRVVLYTSTVDRDWTDWPIRTSFLPAMQRISGWLTGGLEERATALARVGELRELDKPAGLEGLQIAGPDGRERAITASAEGRPMVADTRIPGLYLASGRVAGVKGPLPELAFAVNVDPRESDLVRLDERELKAYFGEKTRTERGAGKDDSRAAFPLWSVLLAAAVGLLFAEGLLVRK